MAAIKDPENTLIIETTKGRVVIELRPDLAPKHVERIKKLAREGFYDGIVFHRVIDGFMAQTGCPHGTGTGGSEATPTCRPSSTPSRTCAASARWRAPQSPNSANSQFFICFDDASFLDKPVHGLGQGHRGHGQRRQDQARRAGPEPGQDRLDEGRRRRLTAPRCRQQRIASVLPPGCSYSRRQPASCKCQTAATRSTDVSDTPPTSRSRMASACNSTRSSKSAGYMRESMIEVPRNTDSRFTRGTCSSPQAAIAPMQPRRHASWPSPCHQLLASPPRQRRGRSLREDRRCDRYPRLDWSRCRAAFAFRGHPRRPTNRADARPGTAWRLPPTRRTALKLAALAPIIAMTPPRRNALAAGRPGPVPPAPTGSPAMPSPCCAANASGSSSITPAGLARGPDRRRAGGARRHAGCHPDA